MKGPRPKSADRQTNGPTGARMGSGKAPELYTLGGVRLVRADVDETSRLGPKHLALLVYLFHEQRPMHPTEVTDLLGHGRGEEKENEGLRRAVVWLRENVPEINIRLTADTIETFGGLHLDTRDVDSALDAGDVGAVAGLYVGEFLEGFESGSPSFDEWAQRERGRLKRAWSNAMLAAAQDAEQSARWDLAASWWQILVARAPMRPEAVAGCLRALAQSGRSAEASSAYGAYLGRLRESGIAKPSDLVQRAVSELRIQAPAADPETAPPVKSAPVERPPVAGGVGAGPDVPLEFESLDFMPESEIEASLDADAAAGVGGFDSLHHHLAWSDMKEEPPGEKVTEEPPPAAAGVSGTEKERPKPAKSKGFEFILPDGETVSEDQADVPPFEAPKKPKKIPAGAFVDTSYERVRHEITSVRKPWAPVLRETWSELAPARSAAAGALVTAGRRIWAGMTAALRATRRGFVALGGVLLAPMRAVAEQRRRSKERATERRRIAVERIQRGESAETARKAKAEPAPPTVQKSAPPVAAKPPAARRKRAKPAPPPAVERPRAQPSPRPPKPAAEKPRVAPTPKPEPARPPLEKPPVAPPKPARPAAEKLRVPPPSQPVRPVSQAPPAPPPPATPSAAEVTPVPPPRPTEEVHRTEKRKPRRKAFWPGRIRRKARPASAPAESPAREAVPRVAARAKPAEPIPEGLRTGPLAWVGRRRRIWAKLRAHRPRIPVLVLLRRFWYAPVAVAVVLLGIVVGPRVADVLGGLTGGLSSQLPEVQSPSLPKVTLPRVGVPKVTLKTPAFVETISEVFSGSLLSGSGSWLVVADVAVEPVEDAAAEWQDPSRSSEVLTLALETDLRQASYFYVMPRERAVLARSAASGEEQGTLSLEDALAVAAAENLSAVVAAAIRRVGGADSISLTVLSPVGDTLYSVAALVTPEVNSYETLAGLTRAVRRRLGEPRSDLEASLLSSQVLSTSLHAVRLYAEAERHFNHGRYSQAVAAAVEAVGRDSTFAMAYRKLAESYAMLGERTRARAALETAWNNSGRLNRREQLRLLGDRHTWDGRYAEAVFTYDELFKMYRDDVGALKSQAIVQRIIGARGLGQGNLKVAYSIDRHDWPPLSRIARYLGYRGRLPDVDSLVASLDGSF